MLAIQSSLGATPRFLRRRITPRTVYEDCCEPYKPCCDELLTRHIGFGADASTTDKVADRVQRIREKMISVGIPAAVGGGIFTTLTFAGAFGLARAERVWTPSLWLGGVAAIAGLINVAIAAKAAEKAAEEEAAKEQASQPGAPAPASAPAPTQTAQNEPLVVLPTPPASFGFGNVYRW